MRLSTPFIIIGLFMAVGGGLALANPFAASLAITTLVGAFMLVSGVFQLWAAVSDRMAPQRVLTGLLGLLALVAGVWLLANPLEGIVSLTLIVGLSFIFTGILRLFLAWSLREAPPFWMLLLSGGASTLLGAIVLANMGEAVGAVLGILLGIELLVDGVALITFGVIGRSHGA